MSGALEGKVAIVTGAGSGIGRAMALLFAREGAAVVVSDIAAQAGGRVAAEIAAHGGSAEFRRGDVADPASHEALVAAAEDVFGALHVAVNNAGISGGQTSLVETPLAKWRRVIDINLSGVFYGLRAQIPAIAAAGGGAIVNIASVMGQVAMANAGAYVASKHALVGLTKTAALETAGQNIRVNAIGPGFITTPMADMLEPPAVAAIGALHALRRWGRAEEVAELALWLASDKSSFATGGFYPVDGGYLAR
jgi:NAD(P)-dependent dehydrogenase (short-subunit alcohol dehydrogenase family)